MPTICPSCGSEVKHHFILNVTGGGCRPSDYDNWHEGWDAKSTTTAWSDKSYPVPSGEQTAPMSAEWKQDEATTGTKNLIEQELRSIARYAATCEERDVWIAAADYVKGLKIVSQPERSSGSASLRSRITWLEKECESLRAEVGLERIKTHQAEKALERSQAEHGYKL